MAPAERVGERVGDRRGAPIVPLSPIPFAPSGFSGDGDSTNSVAISGISAAVSRA